MPTPKTTVLCSLVVVCMTGCTSGSTGSLQTQKPTASATATPNASASLNCRLPVISPYDPGVPPGGWIRFPSGQFERDPASAANRLNAHVPSYDRTIKAWVPVEYRYVAPSGDRYILTNDAALPDPSAFYLVDVRTGTRRLVLGDGPPRRPARGWSPTLPASASIY